MSINAVLHLTNRKRLGKNTEIENREGVYVGCSMAFRAERRSTMTDKYGRMKVFNMSREETHGLNH